MKIKRMFDMHYNFFIVEIDERNEEEIKQIETFMPKSKFLWRIVEDNDIQIME